MNFVRRAAVVALAFTAAVATSPSPAQAIVDPVGDAHAPTFDLVDATFGGAGTRVEAKAYFAVNADDSTWVYGWDALEWQIDTTGDGNEDHVIRISPGGSVGIRDMHGVYQGFDCGLIPGVSRFGPMMRIALDTACFGSPSTYRWRAVMEHGDPVTRTLASEDRVPDSGWSPVVTVGTTTPTMPPTTQPPSTNPSLRALTPARLVDTRSANSTVDNLGAGAGALPAGNVHTVQVAGRGGVPAGATGAVVNVTAVNPHDAGYMTLFPCGTARPVASNLNFGAGQTVGNAAITRLSGEGTLCVYTDVASDLIVDVTGYVPPASQLAMLTPGRLADTRGPGLTVDGLSSGSGALTAGQTLAVQVTGRAGVPAGADTVAVNLTAVEAQGAGFMTLFPCDVGLPNASNLNFEAGGTAAASAVVKLSGDGRLCIYSDDAAHVILDVNAQAAGAPGLVTVTPGRLADTRSPNATVDFVFSGAGRRAAGSTYRFNVAGRGGTPRSATGAMLNVVATSPSEAGFVTVFPCGTLPTTSTLNFAAGITVANSVVAQLSASGEVCVYTYSDTHLIVDVTGYMS